MKQEDKQKLLDALAIISDYCEHRPCSGCIFESDALSEECALTLDFSSPCEWDWYRMKEEE